MFIYYRIYCKQGTPTNRHGGYAWFFFKMDPTIWIPIIVFSPVVVNWNGIFYNLLVFLLKILKFRKMSDWDELSSIAGKLKFWRIYWQWILIEQTSLYTVVYRTSLYNPTNLKVPKKAPWKGLWACDGIKNIFCLPLYPEENSLYLSISRTFMIVYSWK